MLLLKTASHFQYTGTVKTESVEIRIDSLVWIKVVGHTVELQLSMFCDNWKYVEARALYMRCACLSKNFRND